MTTRWPSLTPQRALAESLFGADGTRLLDVWLAAQLTRTQDSTFAAEFSDHIDLPGIRSEDYLHRTIHTSHGNLLGGIRFYGRDITRPFVEIFAHSFGELDRLRSCVAHEWAMFAPHAARLITPPGALSGRPRVLDMAFVALDGRSPTVD